MLVEQADNCRLDLFRRIHRAMPCAHGALAIDEELGEVPLHRRRTQQTALLAPEPAEQGCASGPLTWIFENIGKVTA